MKILTVLTGGTIGSSVKNGIADVDSGTSCILMDICKDYPNIEFEYISPINYLSENATCDTLSEICNFMLNIDFQKYDGVIITHGSDTLAYTSAMLGMVLSWVKIPIAITAADYVLTSPKSNGIHNFRASIDFIKDSTSNLHNNTGVFTIWKNNDENVKVYISTRLNEADGRLDKFSSWGNAEFGTMENSHFKRNSNVINPDFTISCKNTVFLKGKKLNFKNNVLLLQSHVGFDFDSVNIEGKSAVIFKLYHSATACTVGDKTSFLKFAKKCSENNVDVYVYPVKKMDYKYKSTENIKNIISLYNINTSSAYCKALLAYAVDYQHREEIIKENLFYEVVD